MRKIFKICVSGMDTVERIRAIEIMSKALVDNYSKATIVTNEGNATDKAIDAIPTHVDVFIVCSESHHEVAVTGYEAERPAREAKQFIHDDDESSPQLP